MVHRSLRLLSLLFVCSLAATVMAQSADVRLTSLSVHSVAAPGGLLNIYAYYSNSGPSAAKDFTLTLSVPPGTTYANYSVYPAGSPLTCTEPPKGGQGDLVCSASSLPVTSSSLTSIGLVVFVDKAAAPGTVITFPAKLTSTNAIQPSQTLSGSLTVVEPANLKVEMSAPPSAFIGDTFQTTITVTNRGPGAAVNANVDYVEYGIGFETAPLSGPPGWTCSFNTCTSDSFPPGTATFTTSTTSLPFYRNPRSVEGRARAWSPNNTNLTDGEVTATTAVAMPPPTTLKLSLTAAPDTVRPGDPITYTLRITNSGDVDARAVGLQWSVNGSQVSCDSIGDVTCTIGTIAAGATLTVTKTVTGAGPGPVQMTATVTALNVTFDAAIHTVSVSTTPVIPKVDLQAGVSAPAVIHPGEEGLWRYRVTNNGPDTSTNWTLYFTLPSHTTFSRTGGDSSGGPGTCTTIPTNTPYVSVTCNGTTLAPGTFFEKSLYLKVEPSAPAGRILSSASVSRYPDADPNSFNDLATVETQIALQKAVLVPAISADKTTAVAGEMVAQIFTATNQGPDPATAVIFDVTLPAGAAVGEMTSTGVSCTGDAPIHCFAPTLAAGDTLAATISFHAPQTPNEYLSIALVSWENGGSPTGHATTSKELQVLAPSVTTQPPARRRAARH